MCLDSSSRHWTPSRSSWCLTGSHMSQPSLCRAAKSLSSWWAGCRKTNMSLFPVRRQDRGPRGMASPILTFLSNPSFIYPYLQRFLDRALLTRPLPKACLELLHREPTPPEKVSLGRISYPRHQNHYTRVVRLSLRLPTKAFLSGISCFLNPLL